MVQFAGLTIRSVDDLVFGHAPRPLRCGHGLVVGGGEVYPEINFTLPPMTIDEHTLSQVGAEYERMIEGVCRRAVELHAPGLVVELELLPEMTREPAWGEQIVALLRARLDAYHERDGLRSALRVTVVDLRDGQRPILRRSGPALDAVLESLRRCASAGADMLSIESTGGKELCDARLVECDLGGVLVSLSTLAARDMAMLWDRIVGICNASGCVPAGDSACGFANTAMVLAERGMIPRVFAAVVRAASIVRSLVAFERGAVGPSKDCAYEGAFLKAIAGVPVSLEGKAAACAHLSPLGNIPAAYADLWSNESVQNVRLLAGDAPVVSLEQLVYDCRLMNVAAREGRPAALRLRDWLVESDCHFDPQAWILTPDNVVALAAEALKGRCAYARTRNVTGRALDLLAEGARSGALRLSARESRWLDLLRSQFDGLAQEEPQAVAAARLDEVPGLLPGEYGIRTG